jgi:H+/Cl- antiporter ClcA
MSNHRIWRGVILAVIGIGIAGVIGATAYQAGLAHSLNATGGPPMWDHSWGWHGFFFAPFFTLFVLLWLGRLLFWRRSWRGGCHHHHDGVPPAFEEWHRRAHEQQPPESSTK